MITKLLILAVIAWLGFRLYQYFQKESPKKPSADKVENMVSCEHCGIHIPVTEAIKKGDDYYCSAEHLDRSE